MLPLSRVNYPRNRRYFSFIERLYCLALRFKNLANFLIKDKTKRYINKTLAHAEIYPTFLQ